MREQKYQQIETALLDDLDFALKNKASIIDDFLSKRNQRLLKAGVWTTYLANTALFAVSLYSIYNVINSEDAENNAEPTIENESSMNPREVAFWSGVGGVYMGIISSQLFLTTQLVPWVGDKLQSYRISSFVKHNIGHILDACEIMDKDKKKLQHRNLTKEELTALQNYYQLGLKQGSFEKVDNNDNVFAIYRTGNTSFDLSNGEYKVLNRVVSNINLLTNSLQRIPLAERIKLAGYALITPKELKSLSQDNRNKADTYHEESGIEKVLSNDNWNNLAINSPKHLNYSNYIRNEANQQAAGGQRR